VIDYAREKGIPVVAERPQRFFLFGPTVPESEYKRQQRQSRQTYRKAGRTEHTDKTRGLRPHKPRQRK